ncbi:MAG: 3-methyl-2-oxobutanoate hydroxymethyltransferase [Pseudomonadota bacterium]
MLRKTIQHFVKMKEQGEKFSCLTAYDASFAQLMEVSGLECLLIGDSLGMVIKGQDSTLSVSIDDMVYHTNNVRRSTSSVFIMADMPFGACGSLEQSYQNASSLMSAGAQMIKFEGGAIMQETVEFLSQRGIPICSHLGLLPQSVHKTSGYRVQGKDQQSADQILSDALLMYQTGADMLLLECVPKTLAAEITSNVPIPVIGIGAGNDCDAQVLVSYDMLGITAGGGPSFSRNFLADNQSIEAAFKAYVEAVKNRSFPV